MHGLNLILAIIYYIIAVVAVVHVVMDNRQPAKTMAWALVIWFVPFVGIILYLFFGINTRKERLVNQRQLDELSKRSMLGFVEQQDLRLPEDYQPVINLFINQSFSLPFRLSEVELYTDGYQFMLAAVGDATSHIHIDTYIFEDDALGNLVADALIAKARQGVEIRIVYDDVGCWNVRHKFFERMLEEGIEAVPFLPVRFPSFTSKVNYRNHRKLFVIDGQTAFLGGMNIALRYIKGTTTQPWRDTMLRVTGPAVYAVQQAFLTDWFFVDRTLLNDNKYYPKLTLPPSNSPLIQLVTSSPVEPYPEIMQGFVRLILTAKKYVYIETPYFIPTDSVLLALKTAALAGIDVRVLVPEVNDAWMADWAGRSYLREVVDAGVKVSLFTAGFLHSKLMVCDDTIATCGSTNVDFRSFENNFEANAFFYGETICRRLKKMFLDDERQSVPLSSLPDRMRPKFAVRLFEGMVRLLAPLM